MIKKISILLASISILSLGIMACTKENNGGNSDIPSKEPLFTEVEVYAVPLQDKKYMQTDDFSHLSQANEYTVKMADNEYETLCLILNAKKNVQSFNVQVGDLTGKNGNKISKENISVGLANYSKINKPSTSFPIGFYPDIIVPIESRIKKNEVSIKKGENQAVYITINTKKGTPSDNYTGNIIITVDGKKADFKLNTTVWNFQVPTENHSKTAFNLWAPGAFGDMLTNLYGAKAQQAYLRYYEMLIDYRISPTHIPVSNYSNIDKYVETLKQYAFREDVASYSLPYLLASDGDDPQYMNFSYMENLFRKLIQESTNEKNLLKKAYGYFSVLDEPEWNNTHGRIKKALVQMRELIEKLDKELTANGSFNGKQEVKNSFVNFQTLITTKLDPQFNGYIETWVPTFSEFDSEHNQQIIQDLKNNGVDFWWYGCNQPRYPYPSYHIDDNLLPARVLNWMQMKYGVQGNLYWSANVSQKLVNGRYSPIDLYEDPYAWPICAGDGYLVAPAIKYNKRALSPYPTIRLETIRDGQEDYEYLYLLNQLINKKNAKLGTTLTLDDIMDPIYEKLFKGVISTTDINLFHEMREYVANLIVNLKNELTGLCQIQALSPSDFTREVMVYAPKGVSVILDNKKLDKPISKEKYDKYVVKLTKEQMLNNSNISFEKGNKKVSYKIFTKSSLVMLNDFESGIDKVVLSSYASTADMKKQELNTNALSGAKSLQVTAKAVDSVSYIPYIELPKSMLSVTDFSKAKELCVLMKSDSKDDIKINLRIYDENNLFVESQAFLNANEKSLLSFPVDTIKGFDKSAISKVRFYLINQTQNKSDINIIVDNTYIKEK